MLKKILILGISVLSFCNAFSAEPETSVIQIFNSSQQPSWEAPWKFDGVRKSSGTGFVINTKRGKKIMTNAHVVSWAKQILLKRYQDPRPYAAKVAFIGHECDLALLEVEDQSFFEGLDPLLLGDLPKVRSTVTTYGYPAGGEQISYTKGVVSRIEMQSYVHIGNRAFLGVQTDAAINPGNSGGPVIQDGKVVGVAFQGSTSLENTGFFIATPVMNHFIKDVEDGDYHGFPQAGIRMVSLQNPAYRRYLGLPENSDIGARVDSMLPIESTRKVLKPDDVILSIGSFPVGSDATVLYEGNRLSAAVVFQSVQHGEIIPMKIWRDKKEMEVKLPVYVYEREKVLGNQYDVLPRYFVYAGLVFTSLNLDYLKTIGRSWTEGGNAELVYELFYRRYESPETERKETIVLATTLSDPVNANLTTQSKALVDKVNGIKIDKLEDVISALEKSTNQYDVVEFLPNHSIETIDHAEALKANERILKTYNVQRDRRL
ncbi:MAG: peptidase and chymotrypsin/Hap [Verrucomicrobiales bacterium]|nr:peptidase and chymotrypsin/Hap [Verrucomicrobiales bacterium]